jgi:hypothetical protein
MLTGVSNGVIDMPTRYHSDRLAKEHVDLNLLNGFRQLLRTGASVLSYQYRDSRFSQIQMAFLYEHIPPFTERARSVAKKRSEISLFSWQPFPQGVDAGAW